MECATEINWWWVTFFASLIGVMALPLFNNFLPVWFCDKLGWHIKPKDNQSISKLYIGRCSRCTNKALFESD